MLVGFTLCCDHIKPGAGNFKSLSQTKRFIVVIVLWNTVYLERTITTLDKETNATDPDLLRFLSPLGWEHINLTGDYTWPRANQVKAGK